MTGAEFCVILEIEMDLNNLKSKRILILGLGREGRDNFKFLRKLFPKKILGVGDRNENVKCQIPSFHLRGRGGRKGRSPLRPSNVKNVKWYLGENYLKAIKNYDVIVKSPGIPIHLPEIERAFIEGKVISQTEIFLENCPGKIIGITGTKGKSTTASLIYKILKEAGFKAHLIGNIGKPVLSLLFKAKKNDVYIYELSSHQLVNIKKSPRIAVFLNVFPEHLDYYRNFKEYIKAKENITKFQTNQDYLVFNREDKTVKEIAQNSKAKKIPFDSLKLEKIIKIKEIPLKGEFNLKNVKAAIAVGKILGVSDKTLAKAIKKFKPLPHRLEFVGEHRGIKFYNDALSTIPETTIAALSALGKKVQTLILGGFERHLDFSKLAKEILKREIETLILFPTTGQRIWQNIKKEAKKRQIKNLPNNFFVDRKKKTSFSSSPSPRCSGTQYMKDAVSLAYQHTKKGRICLLSCASPSFSIFKSYKEKGNLFKKYIKQLSYEKKS